ncbi:MAG: prephenate dehydrogenase [Firmicutes bacterium]|nr:prephenate dehydrogenase [Bacillota bacterium]
MAKSISRMCLIGCGLIGGSVSLALKRSGAVDTVIGVDVVPETLRQALIRGVVDEAEPDLTTALSGAQLVVVAAPVAVTASILKQVAALEDVLAAGAIVTDVCGAKGRVVEEMSLLFHRATFIGGHPMAGSEKSGIAAADARLLENAVYVLTPGEAANLEAQSTLQSMLQKAGARVRLMSATRHDRVVAAISHVPHLIAATLVNQVRDLSLSDDAYTQLAAGGFRDITRIASSDPALWSELSLENSQEIMELVDDWQSRLTWLQKAIEERRASDLYTFFSEARSFRDLLPAKSTGALRSSYSITVSVPDEPGMIGEIASLLGAAGISIRNIGILESREGDDGQLLLQFDTTLFHDQAANVLLAKGYTIQDRT